MKTTKFFPGDIVYDKDHRSMGTVLDNYGDPVNGDCGDIRLDSDGNCYISELIKITGPFASKMLNISKLMNNPSYDDIQMIYSRLSYHEMEPSAAAQRISVDLDLDYKKVYDLL